MANRVELTATHAPAGGTTQQRGASPTVLLADDDPVIRTYLAALLTQEGYQVVQAEDGHQALLLSTQVRPQIALLDVLMPGLDGFECCRQLRAADPELLCLILTSLHDSASIDKAFAAGASDYITKPIHWPVMRRRIQHLLKASQTLLHLRQQAAREQAMNRVVRAIRRSLELDEIFAVATREIGQLLQADRVSISRYEPQKQSWRILCDYSTQGDSYLGFQIPDSESLVAGHLKKGEMVLIETAAQAEGWVYIPSMAQTYPGSWLLAPLYRSEGSVSSALWGSLCVQLKTARRDWLADSQELITALADHLSIAIQQAELFQQIQELNRGLEEKVKARTAELDRQVEELQRLDRLKADFLSTVSHELRTPLATIKTGIHLLKAALLPEKGTGKSPDPAKIAQYLDVLHRECDREIQLIESLLDLQRLEASAGSEQPSWLQLQEWLPRLAEPFAQQASSQHQRFKLEIPADLPAILTLPQVLGSVLMELLKNAGKFTPAEHLISLQVVNHLSHLEIQVLNTGITIPPEEQKRVFEKLYRVPSSDPWRRGGTGLGLALVHQRAQLLQGEIHLSSEAERTCFALRLPWALGQGKLA